MAGGGWQMGRIIIPWRALAGSSASPIDTGATPSPLARNAWQWGIPTSYDNYNIAGLETNAGDIELHDIMIAGAIIQSIADMVEISWDAPESYEGEEGLLTNHYGGLDVAGVNGSINDYLRALGQVLAGFDHGVELKNLGIIRGQLRPDDGWDVYGPPYTTILTGMLMWANMMREAKARWV